MVVAPVKDTREEFLDTAKRLFAERGFYGASIAAIAAELGLSKQALLHHFGSKEKLYGEVLQQISTRFLTIVERAEAAAPTAEGQLAAVLNEIYKAATENVDESQLLMRELLDNKRRAEHVGTWYLKPFLDALVTIARRTERWRHSTGPEAMAGVYQILGAINYFAISEPTLARMYGRANYASLRRAFPSELEHLIQTRLTPLRR